MALFGWDHYRDWTSSGVSAMLRFPLPVRQVVCYIDCWLTLDPQPGSGRQLSWQAVSDYRGRLPFQPWSRRSAMQASWHPSAESWEGRSVPMQICRCCYSSAAPSVEKGLKWISQRDARHHGPGDLQYCCRLLGADPCRSCWWSPLAQTPGRLIFGIVRGPLGSPTGA